MDLSVSALISDRPASLGALGRSARVRAHRFAENLRGHLLVADLRHWRHRVGGVSELWPFQYRHRLGHCDHEGHIGGPVLHARTVQSQAHSARHRLRHLLAGHYALFNSCRLPDAPASHPHGPPHSVRADLPPLIFLVSDYFC